jgi:hypothetical protein
MTRAIVIMSIAAALGGGCKGKGSKAGTGSQASTGSASGDSGAATGDGAAGGAATGGTSVGAPPSVPLDTPADTAQLQATAAAGEVAKLAPTPKDANAKADLVGRLVDEVVRSVKPQMRESFDPAAIVAAVGKDPVALFKWVRDHTALVPYRGSLRGAVGVVMDRTGNSFDRAMLLAELFAKAGIEARLANATLADDVAGKLTAAWASRTAPKPPVLDNTSDLMQRVAKVMAVAPDALATAASKAAAARFTLATAARDRAVQQSTALAALVPGTASPADTSAFADHWWVQTEGAGGWTDYDPSLADAEPGQTLAAAATTLAAKDVEDDRKHTMTIRLVAEVWQGTERREAKLAEYTIPPQNFFGQKIFVRNIPIDMPESSVMLAAKDPPAALRDAVANQTEWLSLISIGGAQVTGSSVTDDGEVWDMSGDENTMRLGRLLVNTARKQLTAATGMLDSLPGPDVAGDPGAGAQVAKPPMAKETGFTAEWVEIELNSPGAAPVTIRRAIFDLVADRSAPKRVALSDAQRLERNFALITDIEILPMFARFSPGFILDRIVKALSANRALIVDLVRAQGKPMTKELEGRAGDAQPLLSSIYALAAERFAWSPVGDQVYLDRLNILTRRESVGLSPDGRIVTRESFDIMTNPVGVWPTTKDARTTAIQQGVADTVAEAFAVDCGKRDCRRVNASDQYAADGAKGWVRITDASAPELAKLALPQRALVSADLAAGYQVVLSPTPRGDSTWWRVNPGTGETLGMGRHGGTAMWEYAKLAFNVVVTSYHCWEALVGHHTFTELAACGASLLLTVGGGMLAAQAAGEVTALEAGGETITAAGVELRGASGLCAGMNAALSFVHRYLVAHSEP